MNCVVCQAKFRLPEVVATDPYTGGPAHKDCAERPQRAFNLLTGQTLPPARRFLPEPQR